MLCELSEETDKPHPDTSVSNDCGSTPEKGRVWRWRNNSVGSRKNSEGPVLRATVKPVKRFISNNNSPAPSSSGIQQSVQVNTKPTSQVANDELGSSESKTKRQATSLAVSQPCNKKKRVREQWSVEDKDHFFEAVAVHGKDFEAIQKTIAQKHKKRGDETVVKTKDQVRHLYYRTWTTISKLLVHEASSTHNAKGTQELYAVINYGELRKKLGGYLLKKKGILKLNELINYGSTSVRIKGKNYRIKTPSCKALKRMHDKEDAIKKSSVLETRRIKLPLRVNVEMFPLSMSAWNHVHLLAHNPRLKLNVPLDCQLSYLLIYLSKKWRSLSDKMFQVAKQGALHNTSEQTTSSADENSSSMLEIHIPPEATVKAKIDVHEVVITKTNCVVSYAMHKTVKPTSTKKRKKFLSTTETSDLSVSMTTEMCASSEDEGGFTDRLSDAEEQTTASGPIASHCGEDATPSDSASISHETELAIRALQSEQEDSLIFETSGVSSAANSTANASTRFVSTSDPKNGSNMTFEQELEIFVDGLDDSNFAAADSADSNESIPENNISISESVEEKDEPCLGKTENDCQSNLKNDEINISSSPSINKQINCGNVQSIAEVNIIEDMSSPPQASEFMSNLPVQSVDDIDPDKSNENPGNTNSSPHPPKPVIQTSWNSENVGEITLAEVYLMLGKPGSFKLCYCWKKRLQDSALECKTSSTESSSDKVPSSVTALIQAATLLLSKIHKESTETHSKPNSTNKELSKSSSKKEKVGVSVAVQCNIPEKNSATSGNSTSSVSSTSHKRTYGRGTSKFSTPISSISASNQFVVPNVPPSRKRKIQDAVTANNMIVDPRFMPHGIQARLRDVQFRKQMEALNRRIDLFRPQNRNRNSRKPFIVQRTMMPNSGAVRKMMTLSIDSSGANKVGFTPAIGVNEMQPGVMGIGATLPASKAQSSISSNSSQWNPSDQTFGEPLGLKIQNPPDTNQTASGSHNLLQMAAEEAGLSLAPSPKKNQQQNQVETDGSTNAPSPSHDSSSTADNSSVESQHEEATNSDLTEQPQNNSLLIRNDVTLPMRPPTPSVDSIMESFTIENASNIFEKETDYLSNPRVNPPTTQERADLSMPALELPGTPQKLSPVHPWSINNNSRDGLSGFATLNTPQRVLLSDNEDSMDSTLYNWMKRPRLSNNGGSTPSSSFNDTETDLQMQCLMSENSVDFMARFQELMQSYHEHNTDDPSSLPENPQSNDVPNNQDTDKEKKGDG